MEAKLTIPMEDAMLILTALQKRELYGDKEYPMCSEMEISGIETALEEIIAKNCPNGLTYI